MFDEVMGMGSDDERDVVSVGGGILVDRARRSISPSLFSQLRTRSPLALHLFLRESVLDIVLWLAM
ncbi:MAG: hypothetical protein QXE01_11605 [Sulfolobales archaeon]